MYLSTFQEHLLQRTPFIGCFRKFFDQKILGLTIIYIRNSDRDLSVVYVLYYGKAVGLENIKSQEQVKSL